MSRQGYRWTIPGSYSGRDYGFFSFPRHSNVLYAFFYPPMKMEQTECSETSAYKIQTPGNYPEESIRHSEHGESLKSRTFRCALRPTHPIIQRVPELFPGL
jgi:hypothetical protein